MCRPPIALERLEELPDGRLLYLLKRSWRDGTDSVVFEPLEFLERLAALVPAPRFNMIRYSGVLAPAASWRARLAPRRQQPVTTPTASCPAVIANMLALSPSAGSHPIQSPASSFKPARLPAASFP